MTEKSIQESLQTYFLTMTEFSSGDVVINDWRILDQNLALSPYLVIETADQFSFGVAASSQVGNIEIKLNLFVRFLDWSTSLNSFRDVRQALIDKIDSGNGRSAGGLAGTLINDVRSGSEIVPHYAGDVSEGNLPGIMPDYLVQVIILEVEVF